MNATCDLRFIVPRFWWHRPQWKSKNHVLKTRTTTTFHSFVFASLKFNGISFRSEWIVFRIISTFGPERIDRNVTADSEADSWCVYPSTDGGSPIIGTWRRNGEGKKWKKICKFMWSFVIFGLCSRSRLAYHEWRYSHTQVDVLILKFGSLIELKEEPAAASIHP